MDEHNVRIDVSDIQRQIRRQDGVEHGDEPADETVKRVLRSAADLGVLDHTSGSPYWKKKSKHRKRFPLK